MQRQPLIQKIVLKYLAKDKFALTVIKIYFGVTVVLAISELFGLKAVVFLFKPLLIPLLALLYILQSEKRSFYYIAALLFAWSSNIFLLSTTRDYLLHGIITFMLYRLLSIIVVVKLMTKFLFVPFIIAALPFIFIFSCLINITVNIEAREFFPTVINGILISVLAGIALSNYILNDNKKNSWLAISTLLFIALVSIFLFEKYYISNVMFQPISALIFGFAHYTFYRFVIESEKPDLKSDIY